MGDVFRVETMTSNAQVFRAYRSIEGGPADLLAWRPMRQGVCDLHHRTRVSQRANERYLDAFAALDDATRIAEFDPPSAKVLPVSKPARPCFAPVCR